MSLGLPGLADAIRRLYDACSWTEQGESDKAHTVAIASALEGDGSSSISWALAIATAHDYSGEVLLLECDLLHPSFRRDLGLRDGPGLADLLTQESLSESDLDAALCPTRMMNLSLLPAGGRWENPSRLLRLPRMPMLLSELQRRFAFVIMDLPPVLKSSEATDLARLADGVIVVLRAGSTDERVAGQMLRLLSGASIRGAVLNRWRPSTPSMLRRLVAT
jgi:Mrp family chromosome partitioning ATPase